jgi:hypothetical protein
LRGCVLPQRPREDEPLPYGAFHNPPPAARVAAAAPLYSYPHAPLLGAGAAFAPDPAPYHAPGPALGGYTPLLPLDTGGAAPAAPVPAPYRPPADSVWAQSASARAASAAAVAGPVAPTVYPQHLRYPDRRVAIAPAVGGAPAALATPASVGEPRGTGGAGSLLGLPPRPATVTAPAAAAFTTASATSASLVSLAVSALYPAGFVCPSTAARYTSAEQVGGRVAVGVVRGLSPPPFPHPSNNPLSPPPPPCAVALARTRRSTHGVFAIGRAFESAHALVHGCACVCAVWWAPLSMWLGACRDPAAQGAQRVA